MLMLAERRRRQLQHRRLLSRIKIGHLDDLTIRKFERVVMRMRIVQIDLPEARQLAGDFLTRQKAEHAVDRHIIVEGQFRARPEAYRYAWPAYRGKAPRARQSKFRRRQPVSDLGRSRSDIMQTVVAH